MQGTYAVTFAWNDDPPRMGCLDLLDEGFTLESGLGRDRLIRFNDAQAISEAHGGDRIRGMDTVILRFSPASQLRIALMGLAALTGLPVALAEAAAP